MSEPYFDYPPSVPVLQELARPSLLIDEDSLVKAVRKWKILRSIYARGTDFKKSKFSYTEWRDFFFNKTNQDAQCISNKTIRNLIEEDNPNQWEEWKQQFRNTYQVIASIQEKNIENYLNQIEEKCPFKVHAKTIKTTLQNDLSNWLEDQGNQNYKRKETIPSLSPILNEELVSKSEVDNYQNNLEFNFLLHDYAYIAEQFSNPINGIQRLFFHPDYHIPSGEVAQRVYSHLKDLKSIWQQTPVSIIEITYQSSRLKGKVSSYIIYPVCIYYYQRGFYLCAFGQSPEQQTDESNWYNYRLDRIQSIKELDPNTDNIPQDIIDTRNNEQSEQEQQKVQEEETYNGCLVDHIEQEIESAYGFDFYLEKEEMLLRFPYEFDKHYISNTVRHQTFKKIDYEKALQKLNEARITKNQRNKLQQHIKNHSNDGYYTLQYRKNENSVIMRLRAWCPNVEVILPWELRQRMKEDIQQTWELYKNDDD